MVGFYLISILDKLEETHLPGTNVSLMTRKSIFTFTIGSSKCYGLLDLRFQGKQPTQLPFLSTCKYERFK